MNEQQPNQNQTLPQQENITTPQKPIKKPQHKLFTILMALFTIFGSLFILFLGGAANFNIDNSDPTGEGNKFYYIIPIFIIFNILITTFINKRNK